MKVICFGDSNTYGYDPRNYLDGRYDLPWVDIMQEKAGWDIINQGENGREIPVKAPNFPIDTDLLIVMLGTNDLLQLHTPEDVARKMENFIRSLPLAPEKCLLIAPPPMAPGTWTADEDLIEDSAKLGPLYAQAVKDLGIRFADAGQWHIPMGYDGVHFTEEGHIRFAYSLLQFIRENFGKFPNATGG